MGGEVLGIVLYCVLVVNDDVENGICYVVNYGGDFDFIGVIVGNIMGVLYGEDFIFKRWRDSVEMVDLIREVSRDLFSVVYYD